MTLRRALPLITALLALTTTALLQQAWTATDHQIVNLQAQILADQWSGNHTANTGTLPTPPERILASVSALATALCAIASAVLGWRRPATGRT